MSKKEKNFRHVDEWFTAIKPFGEDVYVSGIFFKHGQFLHVQRMIGIVFMDFETTLPDGTSFTARSSQEASWDCNGHCRIRKKRCPTYDVMFAEGATV